MAPVLSRDEIKELINRRRRQILVHSFLYYRMNTSIWSDHKFDEACRELVDLQRRFPEIAAECVYHEYFRDFDGSTGFDLPLHLPEVVITGTRLLRIYQEMQRKEK